MRIISHSKRSKKILTFYVYKRILIYIETNKTHKGEKNDTEQLKESNRNSKIIRRV